MRCDARGQKSFLLAFSAILCANVCFAGSLTDVSGSSSVALNSGSDLIVNFGTWTYSSNNQGYTPVPTALQFEAYGPQITAALSSVPGSSAQYYSGYRLTGYLESADGSIVVPLDDSNADRTGLAAGSLLVTPGTYTGANGSRTVSVLAATVTLSENMALSLFGPNASRPWVSDAKIVLVNGGLPLTLGLGGSDSMRSATGEPGLRGSGPVQTAGVTLSVQLDVPGTTTAATVDPVPEPGGIYLLAGGLALIGAGSWFNASGRK